MEYLLWKIRYSFKLQKETKKITLMFLIQHTYVHTREASANAWQMVTDEIKVQELKRDT